MTRRGRPNSLVESFHATLVLERKDAEEFSKKCDAIGVSLSEGVRDLIKRDLLQSKEKNGEGAGNPSKLYLEMVCNNFIHKASNTVSLECVNNYKEIGKLLSHKGEKIMITCTNRRVNLDRVEKERRMFFDNGLRDGQPYDWLEEQWQKNRGINHEA